MSFLGVWAHTEEAVLGRSLHLQDAAPLPWGTELPLRPGFCWAQEALYCPGSERGTPALGHLATTEDMFGYLAASNAGWRRSMHPAAESREAEKCPSCTGPSALRGCQKLCGMWPALLVSPGTPFGFLWNFNLWCKFPHTSISFFGRLEPRCVN